MEINDRVKGLLEALADKYKLEGQEMEGYLEGLVYQDYLDYWDYINEDALLNLQNPITNIPDEMIFIMYHQITELYFKLSLWEYKQITGTPDMPIDRLIMKINRINNYFKNLTRSFEIMIYGMEPEQFLKFRLSLLPASGFQSVQYRMIEIASTDLINLVNRQKRDEVRNSTIEEQYKYIYWKYGATETATGKKTLTLRRFEQKYADHLVSWAHKHEKINLLQILNAMPEEKVTPELLEAYRQLDLAVNVRWPLVHLKSAARYLKQDKNNAVAATGGTNWQQYLPPKVQQRVFFPDLWSQEEKDKWGIISKEELMDV